jgi:translation initiation factor 4A
MNSETSHSEYRRGGYGERDSGRGGYGRGYGGSGRGGGGGGGGGRPRGRGGYRDSSDRDGVSDSTKYNPFRREREYARTRGGGGGGGRGEGRDSEEHKDGSASATPVSAGVHSSASFTSLASETEGIPFTPIVASGAGGDDKHHEGEAHASSETTPAATEAEDVPFSKMSFPPLYDGPTTFERWDDEVLALDDSILRGIYGYGFDTPSPVQRMSIIPIKYGRDIIAQAQSGTGKTGAFTLGTLSRVDISQPTTQAIILAPTRELSEQIHYVINQLGQYVKPKTALLIGGTSSADDVQRLRYDPPHVVVGCPGRINDMLKRGALSSASVKLLVLDEADEMLSHGFSDQIYHIVRQLSKTAQIALFSATFPPELEPLTEKFMREPLKMLVEKEVINLAGIHQYKVDVSDDSQKYFVMKDIFKSIAVSQCIIYCNSVSRVESLTRAMVEDGFPVICIHSNMPTKERQMIIEEFKRGKQRVLVSSDITARGLDVQQVSVVVNFDLPRNKHTYLHRIGRCGRWGRKGVAINFVNRRDYISLHEIENWYNIKIEELPLDYENKIRRA